MTTPSVGMAQYCSCKRSKEHLHYSTKHDTSVRSGLALVLLIEGLSFVSGSVQGSIRVYLAQNEITAYDYVTRRIAEATAPYEGLNILAMGLELLVVLLLILSAATLHSTTTRGLHRVTVYGAVLAFLAKWGAYTLYDIRTTQAVSLLNFEPYLLRTANNVQSLFAAEAGFWGSSAFYSVTILLSLMLLGLLAFAAWELHTRKIVSVWPSMQLSIEGVEPAAPAAIPASVPTMTPSVVVEHAKFCESCGSQMPAQTTICSTCGHRSGSELLAAQSKSTKFCRFCGAKIPRDSEFYEECGKRLVS